MIGNIMNVNFVNCKKGFTLVEALLASVVLGIGLFTVGLALYAEFNFIHQNRERAIATLAAQEYIEKIRGMPYDNGPGNNDIAHITSSWAMNSANKPAASVYLNGFSGAVAVEDSYGADVKKVSVRITWNSLAGRQLETQLATLVTRSGIDRQ